MERQHWQDWLIGAIGLWLIISGFWLNVTLDDGAGLWAVRGNFVVLGILVALFAFGALAAYSVQSEIAILLFGLWLTASPWIFGFATFQPATVNALTCGIALLLLGVWSLATNNADRKGRSDRPPLGGPM